jgi:hypothetical protein
VTVRNVKLITCHAIKEYDGNIYLVAFQYQSVSKQNKRIVCQFVTSASLCDKVDKVRF